MKLLLTAALILSTSVYAQDASKPPTGVVDGFVFILTRCFDLPTR